MTHKTPKTPQDTIIYECTAHKTYTTHTQASQFAEQDAMALKAQELLKRARIDDAIITDEDEAGAAIRAAAEATVAEAIEEDKDLEHLHKQYGDMEGYINISQPIAVGTSFKDLPIITGDAVLEAMIAHTSNMVGMPILPTGGWVEGGKTGPWQAY